MTTSVPLWGRHPASEYMLVDLVISLLPALGLGQVPESLLAISLPPSPTTGPPAPGRQRFGGDLGLASHSTGGPQKGDDCQKALWLVSLEAGHNRWSPALTLGESYKLNLLMCMTAAEGYPLTYDDTCKCWPQRPRAIF